MSQRRWVLLLLLLLLLLLVPSYLHPLQLDLVEEDDQFTHMITLEDATGGEEILNVFKCDPEYEENERK